MRSFKSTLRSLEVFISISNGGCDELVHHFDTVVGAHPSCLDSQRLDFFFSTSTTFKRLRSLLPAILQFWINGTKLQNSSQNKDKSHKKVAKSDDFNEFRSSYALKSIGNARIIVSKTAKLIYKVWGNWPTPYFID